MVDNFKVNLIVAICVGLAGAIFFTFFPEIFREKKGFKDFIGIFILSFIGFAFVGFVFALFFGTF